VRVLARTSFGAVAILSFAELQQITGRFGPGATEEGAEIKVDGLWRQLRKLLDSPQQLAIAAKTLRMVADLTEIQAAVIRDAAEGDSDASA
jgi:hypothetical protein